MTVPTPRAATTTGCGWGASPMAVPTARSPATLRTLCKPLAWDALETHRASRQRRPLDLAALERQPPAKPGQDRKMMPQAARRRARARLRQSGGRSTGQRGDPEPLHGRPNPCHIAVAFPGVIRLHYHRRKPGAAALNMGSQDQTPLRTRRCVPKDRDRTRRCQT